MELAFASLHQLCGPLLERLEGLPAPQRQAMEIVFGLTAGQAPDRFLVGLAALSLFSEVAEQRPLLCVGRPFPVTELGGTLRWSGHSSAPRGRARRRAAAIASSGRRSVGIYFVFEPSGRCLAAAASARAGPLLVLGVGSLLVLGVGASSCSRGRAAAAGAVSSTLCRGVSGAP